MTPDLVVLDRIAAKSVEVGGCWLFTGADNGGGYGQVRSDRRNRLVHIVAYETLIGPVPEGLELDHECENRPCWNPEHLDPVTHAVNVARGDLLAARTARSGVCQRGHQIKGDNNYRGSCRTCRNERCAEWHRRNR